MRLELSGSPSAPVTVEQISAEVIRLATENFGKLDGIEAAASRVAGELVTIASKITKEYKVIISLNCDGDYYFGVKVPWFTDLDDVLHWREVGSLPCGCPFAKHLAMGFI